METEEKKGKEEIPLDSQECQVCKGTDFRYDVNAEYSAGRTEYPFLQVCETCRATKPVMKKYLAKK